MTNLFRTFLVFFIVMGLLACQVNDHKESKVKISIQGKTMGTTYHVTYFGFQKSKEILQQNIDDLLTEINSEVSTYIPTSTISQFNQTDSIFCVNTGTKKHFETNYLTSLAISISTNNYFDPTIMPLVNYWGFGYTSKKQIKKVDSLIVKEKLQCVGLDNIRSTKDSVYCFYKKHPCTQLDFSALAKGYGVDKISQLLIDKNYNNHLVEIGGETVARGTKEKQPWLLGISNPIEGSTSDSYDHIIELKDKGMATSGNYRNFYKKNGKTFSHTINPKTGYTERSNLLSVTVIADDCMTADAFATAYMAMGLTEAVKHVNTTQYLESFFIYIGDNDSLHTLKSKGFEGLIQE